MCVEQRKRSDYKHFHFWEKPPSDENGDQKNKGHNYKCWIQCNNW